MRSILLISPILLIISYPALCQVDTLQLVEIGSIQAPSGITELYVEDLDGDSLKEIIFTTATNVYTYNGITYQPIWVSPALANPRDLNFADINNDSLIDLSVKDNANIYLYDPHNSQTLWTSPTLDSTYRCYAIGDRNGDGWIDIAYINYRPINDSLINDTVSVIFYDGPTYDADSIILIFAYWDHSDMNGWSRMHENPEEIIINNLSNNQSYNAKIIIFISQDRGSGIYSPNQHSNYNEGALGIIDGDSLYYHVLDATNKTLSHLVIEYLGSNVLCTVGRYHSSQWGHIDYSETRLEYSLFSSDSLLIDIMIYYCYSDPYSPPCPLWRASSMGEYWSSNNNREFIYGIDSTVNVYSIPDYIYITEMDFIDMYQIIGPINLGELVIDGLLIKIDRDLFNYAIIDINNNNIIGYIYDNIWFSHVSDLNNDLNDEILRSYGSQILIYNIERYTGNNEQGQEIPGICKKYYIDSNYPNPFNSSTTIEYGLPEAGRVRIDIYDLLGRKVETLVDEKMQAGRHQVIWEASGYSSGIYFYRIEAGDFVDTKRMVYLK